MAERANDIQPAKPAPSGGANSSPAKTVTPDVRNAGNVGADGQAGVDTSGGKSGANQSGATKK